MICYKDKTFCSSDCINNDCDHLFTADMCIDSVRLKLPVSMHDFSKDCKDYKNPIGEKQGELF